MVQRRHGVDDPEHHGCFHPIVHQVGISQAGCKGARGTLILEPDGCSQNTGLTTPTHPDTSPKVW